MISRRGSSSSGVGGHSSLEEGCVLISRRGSSSSGVGGHSSLEEGCVLISRRGSSSSGVGGRFFFCFFFPSKSFFANKRTLYMKLNNNPRTQGYMTIEVA